MGELSSSSSPSYSLGGLAGITIPHEDFHEVVLLLPEVLSLLPSKDALPYT